MSIPSPPFMMSDPRLDKKMSLASVPVISLLLLSPKITSSRSKLFKLKGVTSSSKQILALLGIGKIPPLIVETKLHSCKFDE